jgi:hypothetical protein
MPSNAAPSAKGNTSTPVFGNTALANAISSITTPEKFHLPAT